MSRRSRRKLKREREHFAAHYGLAWFKVWLMLPGARRIHERERLRFAAAHRRYLRRKLAPRGVRPPPPPVVVLVDDVDALTREDMDRILARIADPDEGNG